MSAYTLAGVPAAVLGVGDVIVHHPDSAAPGCWTVTDRDYDPASGTLRLDWRDRHGTAWHFTVGGDAVLSVVRGTDVGRYAHVRGLRVITDVLARMPAQGLPWDLLAVRVYADRRAAEAVVSALGRPARAAMVKMTYDLSDAADYMLLTWDVHGTELALVVPADICDRPEFRPAETPESEA